MARPFGSASCSASGTSARSNRSTLSGIRSKATAGGRACSSIAFHCKICAVTESEFFFAFAFSSQGPSAPFLDELAAGVLGHLGCSPTEVPELAEALAHALAAGARGERRCDVRFLLRGQMLEIQVASNGGTLWRTAHRLR